MRGSMPRLITPVRLLSAAMDSAPGVSQVVDEIHTLFQVDPLMPATFVPINSSNPSWSSLYPGTCFISRPLRLSFSVADLSMPL